MNTTPKLPEVIRQAFASLMEGVHVSTIGRVVSYDTSKCTADVQPLIRRARIDERGQRIVELMPIVPDVQVAFMGGGSGSLTFDLSAGDLVVLVFADESLDRFVVGSGSDVDPGDDRRHDITDAVAFPCVSLFKSAHASTAGAVVLKGNDVRLGSANANGSGNRVATKSSLDDIPTALTAAAAAIIATNPSGAAALTAFKDALSALGFPNCASKVRAE